MKNLAIIPARSGSKGLKDKNIKDLNGKPLIAYSIEAALESQCFETVMVSTDSEQYANIARAYGAEVPFLRSKTTASDTASSWDAVHEVLDEYQKIKREFQTFCLLQPTSPLRTSQDIKNAYQLFVDRAAHAVVSVCEAEHSPLWCGQLPENLELANFIKPEALKRRQDTGKFYRLNGAIYIVDVNKFMTEKSFYPCQKESYAYIMSQEKSIDIDTELDFRIASMIISILKPT